MNILFGAVAKAPQSESSSLMEDFIEGVVVDNQIGATYRHKNFILRSFAKASPATDSRYTCWILGFIHGTGDFSSPAAFALNGWLSGGVDFFSNVHGSYLVVIHDRINSEVFLISDHHSTRLVFCTETRDFFLFGSRPDHLQRFPGFDRQVDLSAVSDFLTCGAVMGNQTFHKSLQSLPPHSCQKISPRGSSLETYSVRKEKVAENISLEAAANEFYRRLKYVVRDIEATSGVKKANLSGGADTRILLSVLGHDIEFQTYNSASGTELSADVQIAQSLARKFGLNHIVKNKVAGTEKVSPPFARYAFKDVLFGQKKFCGSFSPQGDFDFQHCADLDRKAMSSAQNVFRWDSRQLHDDSANSFLKELKRTDLVDPVTQLLAPTYWRSYYTTIYADSDFLWITPYHKTQRTNVTPFLSTYILDFILGIPLEYKNDHRLYKQLFRRYLPEYMEIPFHSQIAKRDDDFKKFPIKTKKASGSSEPFNHLQFIREHLDRLEPLEIIDTQALGQLEGNDIDVEIQRRLTGLVCYPFFETGEIF